MEENRIKEGLEEVITSEIGAISAMKIGSDERTKAVNELTKLHALRADEERLSIEAEKVWHDEDKTEKEESHRVEQAAIEAKDRKFNKCMAVASLMVPVVFYTAYYYTGLKVDAEGRYIPGPVRELCKHFRPTTKK